MKHKRRSIQVVGRLLTAVDSSPKQETMVLRAAAVLLLLSCIFLTTVPPCDATGPVRHYRFQQNSFTEDEGSDQVPLVWNGHNGRAVDDAFAGGLTSP
eukprot:2566248-Rhodomonas_salina.1